MWFEPLFPNQCRSLASRLEERSTDSPADVPLKDKKVKMDQVSLGCQKAAETICGAEGLQSASLV